MLRCQQLRLLAAQDHLGADDVVRRQDAEDAVVLVGAVHAEVVVGQDGHIAADHRRLTATIAAGRGALDSLLGTTPVGLDTDAAWAVVQPGLDLPVAIVLTARAVQQLAGVGIVDADAVFPTRIAAAGAELAVVAVPARAVDGQRCRREAFRRCDIGRAVPAVSVIIVVGQRRCGDGGRQQGQQQAMDGPSPSLVMSRSHSVGCLVLYGCKSLGG